MVVGVASDDALRTGPPTLMQPADLFELTEAENPDTAIDRLNDLLVFYAGGTISKLRPRWDNSAAV